MKLYGNSEVKFRMVYGCRIAYGDCPFWEYEEWICKLQDIEGDYQGTQFKTCPLKEMEIVVMLVGDNTPPGGI